MTIIITFFDKDFKGNTYKLQGKYFEHFVRVFPEYKTMLKKADKCIAFFAGKDNAQMHAYSIAIKSVDFYSNRILFEFGESKKLDLLSKAVARQVRRISTQRGYNDTKGMSPLVCIFAKEADILGAAAKANKVEELMKNKDYKGVCMMFAPLSESSKKPEIWDDADALYALGISCSKLSVTLLIKANETKKLMSKTKYRKYCVAFLTRGYEIEQGNVRFAAALAYRYYSNVHELMRAGERRDSDLEFEIEKANEWLSKAIEMNPGSVRNHYRKGKLIIEKQVPYLLFGKRSYGTGEAKILREIKQVGEEHLASAISLFEQIKDEEKRSANKREYAKALFVLGRYYLNDTNLPIHAYYLNKLAGKKPIVKVEEIDKLNLESARANLKKSFAVESDIPLDSQMDVKKLSLLEKEWTNSPIKKLYHIGCVYSDTAFVLKKQGSDEKAQRAAVKAIKILQIAKKVADSLKNRKRNTWYISEKIAWTYMHIEKYEVAAKLLKNARAGYVVNTYAIALMLCGDENMQRAREVLSAAAADKHNLAGGLSKVLQYFAAAKTGDISTLDAKDLSEKNKKLAKILDIEFVN